VCASIKNTRAAYFHISKEISIKNVFLDGLSFGAKGKTALLDEAFMESNFLFLKVKNDR
jgi:hypothetical protein